MTPIKQIEACAARAGDAAQAALEAADSICRSAIDNGIDILGIAALEHRTNELARLCAEIRSAVKQAREEADK